MLKTLLHKTLLTALLILLGGWAAVAQVHVVMGDAKSFSVEPNENYLFHWSVYNKATGTTDKYLTSKTHETELVTFDTPGTFEVRVYPEDKGNHCYGEQLVIEVVVNDGNPTAIFAQTLLTAICARSNGTDRQETAKLEVQYTGPKPWTFKYRLDSSPPVQPEGADAIMEDNFVFELSIPNATGRSKDVEILLVEAEALIGIPVEVNPEKQRAEVKVLKLPVPEFETYEAVKLINTSATYVGVIGKNSSAQTFVSDGGTIVNTTTEKSADGESNRVMIDVEWGTTPGDQKVMLIEKNALSCYSDTLYANISLVETFSVSIDGDLVFCEGDSRTLQAKVDLPGNYSYEWSTGSKEESTEVSAAGNCSVTVTDLESGVSETASVDVSLWPGPTVYLGEDYLLGDGEVVTLDAKNEGCGYQWSTGETTQTIEVNALGSYQVTVTDANSCSASDEILLYNVFAIELGVDQEICADQVVILDPNPNIEQDYTYSWSTGASTRTITVNDTGDYTVTVRDNAGNERIDQVHVEVHPLPIVDLGPDLVLFDGESKVLDPGDAGDNVTYTWNTGANTRTITVSEEGVYSCKVTDANGCSNADDISLTSKLFSVDLGGEKNGCLGERIYLEPVLINFPAGAEASYEWSNQSTEKGIFVEESGEYCVTVSNGAGTTENDCVEVIFNPSPYVDLGPDVFAEEGQVVELDAQNPNSFYNWFRTEDPNYTLGVEQFLEVTQRGTYSVMVTNTYNCMATDSVTVEFDEKYDLLPSGFTPNGDFQNDKLRIKEEYRDQIAKMSLVIYNRIGQKVFQSNNMDVAWDGTYRGQMQDMDAYVYVIKVTFKSGKKIVKRGNITLLH